MAAISAVLFDFGGTLYDYQTLDPGDRECLVELARAAGVAAETEAIRRAHRDALRGAFYDYLPRPFYLHADLFRDALTGMGETFGVKLGSAELDRYRQRQRQLHRRDFRLRDGVFETLAALRDRGLVLGIVSNIDRDQLDHLVELAGFRSRFDWLLSSEEARSCKPDPAIFAEALRRAGCRPEEALFVGDTLAQDVAGANRAGMRSALLWHRDDRPAPDGEVRPHHVIRRIPDLLGILEGA